MLPGGDNVGYRQLLAGPHEPVTRVQVWRQGVRIDPYGTEGVPFLDGGLTATLMSQVTREARLMLAEEFYTDDLMQPWGNELYIFQGIKPGAGVPWLWQTFRGRINTITMSEEGITQLTALDRAADINDANFLRPENSQVGDLVDDEFRRLINDAVDDATFGAFNIPMAYTPEIAWEWDRGSACDDLAAVGSGFWYALANGDYVLRRIPWTYTQVPVATLTDGDGGTLYLAVPSRSREDVFNAVTVYGERADGTLPVYATAADTDPLSPTNTMGGFGVKSKLVRSQTASSQSQAFTMARAALLQSRSLTQTWALSCPTDAALELGDAVTVEARGLPPEVQVVQSFTLSFVGDEMSINTRALSPGLELF